MPPTMAAHVGRIVRGWVDLPLRHSHEVLAVTDRVGRDRVPHDLLVDLRVRAQRERRVVDPVTEAERIGELVDVAFVGE